MSAPYDTARAEKRIRELDGRLFAIQSMAVFGDTGSARRG
jgi:hypothetical protein